jgi:hypothetical protein
MTLHAGLQYKITRKRKQARFGACSRAGFNNLLKSLPVATVPTVMAVPMATPTDFRNSSGGMFGGRRSARAGQRHRVSLLRRCDNKHQACDGEKSEEFLHVMLSSVIMM